MDTLFQPSPSSLRHCLRLSHDGRAMQIRRQRIWPPPAESLDSFLASPRGLASAWPSGAAFSPPTSVIGSSVARAAFSPAHVAMMAADEVEDKVKGIIAEQLGVEAGSVKPDSSFTEDLGADSLDAVELIMAIEEAFDIEIPDEEAETMTTPAECVAAIKAKL